VSINPNFNAIQRHAPRGTPASWQKPETIISALNSLIENMPDDHPVAKLLQGQNCQGVSKTHLAVLAKLFDIAMTDHVDKIESVKCPHCASHQTIVCGDCGNPVSVEVPNATMQRNQLGALNKLSDKYFPNLASVTTDVNIASQIDTYVEAIVMIITRYVPADRRMEALSTFKSATSQAIRSSERGEDFVHKVDATTEVIDIDSEVVVKDDAE